MSMKRLVVLVVLVGAAIASATTMLALDVAGLTRGSDLVVRGVVTDVHARLTGDGARIMTDTELRVTQVLKGPSSVRSVVVMQPGGVVGDLGQHVGGTAKFTVDEDVVVFLERRGERYLVTGMSQGKLTVERSSPGAKDYVRGPADADALLLDAVTHQPVNHTPLGMTFDELVKQVSAAVERAPAPTVTPTAPVKGTR